MGKSISKRAIDDLRKAGYFAAKAEHYNVHARRSFDLFGFVDVVAVHPKHGWLMLQVTSSSNVAARLRKIAEDHGEKAETMLSVPFTAVEVWGWNKAKGKWRKVQLTIAEVRRLAAGG